jgi:NAD(P)-dependent dehydrogenase (short-subunit alcohol dehydrogenase family)
VDALPLEQVKYMTDKIPMKRTGEIEEIAALVAFIASKEARYLTCHSAESNLTASPLHSPLMQQGDAPRINTVK